MHNYITTKTMGEAMTVLRRYDVLRDINSDLSGLACIVSSMSEQYAEDGCDLSLVAQSLDLMHAALRDVLDSMSTANNGALDYAQVSEQSANVMECAALLERLAASDCDLNESRQEIADTSKKLETVFETLDRIVDSAPVYQFE